MIQLLLYFCTRLNNLCSNRIVFIKIKLKFSNHQLKTKYIKLSLIYSAIMIDYLDSTVIKINCQFSIKLNKMLQIMFESAESKN